MHGQTRYNIPSRFLKEIPENLLKFLHPVQEPADTGRLSGEKSYRTGALISNSKPRMKGSASGILDSDNSKWSIGQNVLHAKFGEGIIVNCEGGVSDGRVQVKFSQYGIKWLSLEYAKLTPA